MAGWRSPRSTRSLSINEMIRRLSVSVVLFAMASAIAWLTWQTVPSKSQSKDPDAELQDISDTNITPIRSNGSYWADGGIVSTADEMNRFLKALKGGRLIRSGADRKAAREAASRP